MNALSMIARCARHQPRESASGPPSFGLGDEPQARDTTVLPVGDTGIQGAERLPPTEDYAAWG